MSDVISSIRRKKLPDPKACPNVGSFFKNPVVGDGVYKKIVEAFPDAKDSIEQDVIEVGAIGSGDIRPDTVYTKIGEVPNLGQVLDQDSELLPVVQKGIRSRGFKGPVWSEQEQRLRHFHKELDRYLSGEK